MTVSKLSIQTYHHSADEKSKALLVASVKEENADIGHIYAVNVENYCTFGIAVVKKSGEEKVTEVAKEFLTYFKNSEFSSSLLSHLYKITIEVDSDSDSDSDSDKKTVFKHRIGQREFRKTAVQLSNYETGHTKDLKAQDWEKIKKTCEGIIGYHHDPVAESMENSKKNVLVKSFILTNPKR